MITKQRMKEALDLAVFRGATYISEDVYEALQAAIDRVAAQLGQTGRVLVRESGTEPVIRVMVEAPQLATCQEYVDQILETIRTQGHEA